MADPVATGHPFQQKKRPAPKPKPKPPAPKPKPKPRPAQKPGTKPPAKKKTPAIDKRMLAEQYGWELSVLQSIPELMKLFNQSIDEGWTAEHFVAKVRESKWWADHSDQFRQMYILEKGDPGKYKRIQTETFSKVHDIAASMGVRYDAKRFGDITRQALYQGWSDSQIRNALAGMLDFASGGHFGGEAGQAEATLRAFAQSMGIKVGDSTLKTWMQQLVRGDKTIEDFEAYIRSMAESAFPAYADKIKAGLTMSQIADPYIQSMASILEINPNAIDLNDSTIRRALSSTSQDGTTASGKPLWQFEYELKQDPRWLKTNNARESINSVAHDVLKTLGFVY